jgi:hypothetical protein
MSEPILIQIVGTPVACATGVRETWREVAGWVERQLAGRFGAGVQVVYYDLFDPQVPPLPDTAELPLVLVQGEVLSSGGRISVPALRQRLEALGLPALG